MPNSEVQEPVTEEAGGRIAEGRMPQSLVGGADVPDEVECDVLVVGSGAAGLMAALAARHAGLDVVIAEKEAQLGGTTARSGGWLWVPCNPVSRRAGVADSLDAARSYIAHEAKEHFDPARVEAFLAAGPEMIAFCEARTRVRFSAAPAFPDYHMSAPGAAVGRPICAMPFDGRLLGRAVHAVQRPMRAMTFLGMAISSGAELGHFLRATRSVRSAAFVLRRLVAQARDRLRYGRGMRMTNGNALVGRLLASVCDAQIPLWLDAPVTGLISAQGEVRGAVVQSGERRVVVQARRGVVLATGGFSHDAALRKELLAFPARAEDWPLAPAGNTGDGLRLGRSAGGTVAADLAQPAAWAPVSRVRWGDGEEGSYAHIIDRAKPGVIAVLRTGERFVDEACSYHDFVAAMREACRHLEEVEAFLICDHRALRRYGLGFVKPFPVPIRRHLASGYLARGRTPEELAARLGVDVPALARTVARYNAEARHGRDPEFGKGGNAYDHYMGDADARPSPCVAPLETPPYYAVRVMPGILTTYPGLRTDERARVLDAGGLLIAGLYAVGSDMLTLGGGGYLGGGANLGPAMTFGFIAGRDLAEGQSRPQGGQ